MILDTLLQAVGTLGSGTGGDVEIEALLAADQAAGRHLKRHGGAIIDLQSNIIKWEELFDGLMAKHYNGQPRGDEHPEDLANDQRQARTHMAYYFGLAIGLRLGGAR